MAEEKVTLPKLIAESELLTQRLLESGGEIDADLEQALSMTGKQLKEKLDAYGYVLDAIKSRNSYAIARMSEWGRVASECERAMENLEERIKFALGQLEIPELHGFEYTFALRENPPKVIIDDEEKLPAVFLITETKTTTRPDKKLILDAIKEGMTVPGAHAERGIKLVQKVSARKIIEPKPLLEEVTRNANK